VEDLDWDRAEKLIRRDLTPLELRRERRPVSTGKDFAVAMDESDPLRDYRERFLFPKHAGGDCVYLCGHSLGLQPKTAAAYIQQELNDWAQLGVEAHFRAKNPWMPYHRLLTEQTAALVGAKPVEVVVMNSLTVNLHLMMVSFLPSYTGQAQNSGGAGCVPFRSVCGEVADSISMASILRLR
jgi:hypothetical protein